MDLSSLRLNITIGAANVQRAPFWSIQSERHVSVGRADITLPDPAGDLYRTIRQGDPVQIRYGYGNADATWTGTVRFIGPGRSRDLIEVVAGDGALPLSRTRVVQSWENDSPEAIVKWAIRQTGLPIGRVDSPGMILPHFAACNIPVWQLARQASESCRWAFGLDMSRWALWMGAGGVNWGDFDEPGAAVAIATGETLINHQPEEREMGLSRVESLLLPGLTHSRLIDLQDDKRGIELTARALKVRHEGTPERIRTFVWYGKERG